MKHCTRCRADAVGLLGRDQAEEVRLLMKKASTGGDRENAPYVAVASMEGLLVNQHLGEASQLWIFEQRDGKAELMERRFTPSAGSGSTRWTEMADLLKDCRAVLVSGIGRAPLAVLEEAGLRVVVMEGFAREGVEALFSREEIPRMLLRKAGSCGQGLSCGGTGMGCG